MPWLGVVTTSFPQHEDDMAGRFVQTHLRRQLEPDMRFVHVVAIGRRNETTEREGVRITRIASDGLFDGDGAPEIWERSRGMAKARVLAEAARVTAALTQAVSSHARYWDAVESHWLVPSSLSVAQAAPGLFHRAFAHSGDVAWLEAHPGGASLARWLLSRLNEVVCVSEPLAERLATLVGGTKFPTRLKVAPMPVDAAVFSPRLAHPPRRDLVVGVGRLVPIKAFDALVMAVGGIPASLRPAVILLGEGHERRRLASLAEKLAVNLHMPGARPPAEVAAWLTGAAACVICSRTLRGGRTEGSPLVLREAVALGTPVVTTLKPRGVASGAELHFVPPDDIPALRSALCKILRSSPAGAHRT